MKKICLLFIAVALTGFVANSQNLLPNGDFSSWSEGKIVPDQFEYGAATGAEACFSKIENAYQEGGQNLNALGLTYYNSSASSTRYFISSSMSLPAGNYKLSFYLRGEGWFRSVNILKTGTSNPNTAQDNPPTVYVRTPFFKTNNNTRNEQEFTTWTKIELDYSIEAGDYSLCISFNNDRDENKEVHTMEIANISFTQNLVTSDDNTLKSLKLSAEGYTDNATNKAESVPLFDPEVLEYDVELSYTFPSDLIPQLVAEKNDPTAQITNISQATSLSAPNNVATVTVKATDNSERTYTVRFIQTKDFISGFFNDQKKLANKGDFSYINTDGTYCRTANPDGKYWGEFTIRTTSSDKESVILDMITPALINGAGKLSFSVTQNEEANRSALLVKYRENETSDWVQLDSILSESLTTDWIEKEYVINNASATSQVRVYTVKLEGSASNFKIDDFRVTAYSSGSSVEKTKLSATGLEVYTSDKGIRIKQAGASSFFVSTVTGQVVASGNFTNEAYIPVSQKGVYIVKAGTSAKKISIK